MSEGNEFLDYQSILESKKSKTWKSYLWSRYRFSDWTSPLLHLIYFNILSIISLYQSGSGSLIIKKEMNTYEVNLSKKEKKWVEKYVRCN